MCMPKLTDAQRYEKLREQLADLKAGKEVVRRKMEVVLSPAQLKAIDDQWAEQQKLRAKVKARTKEQQQAAGYKTIREVHIEVYEEAVNAQNPLTILQKELYPSIDDLFENNLYKITHEKKDYIIPLWHHELIYDMYDTFGNTKEMIVRCIPILPPNINIDCENNLHVKINKNIRELWNNTSSVVLFSIGKQLFEYPKKNIRFMKHQTLKLLKKGVSTIDSINIFNITKKANIYIELELWLDE